MFNELFESERAKIVSDELLVVEGKVFPTISPGNRVVADRLLTLGKRRRGPPSAPRLSRGADAQRLKVEPFVPARQFVCAIAMLRPVRLALECHRVKPGRCADR